MRRLARSLAVSFAILAVAAPVAAQTPIGPTSDEPPPVLSSVIDFSQVVITAELTRPDGSYAILRGKTRFRNLIELRGNFRPELARSASKLP